jgi:hypothetical protein
MKLKAKRINIYSLLYSMLNIPFYHFRLILQEFPDFSQVIEGPLAENGIKVPSRPVSGIERPSTGAS